MSRILTGIQSSGRPHLGNLLGAIQPGIALSNKAGNEGFFFIADLHSMTTIKDSDKRIENTMATAAAWLAFGFDTEKNTFYRQSKVTEVCELTWYLSCLAPYPMLANAHSFKDKANKLSDVLLPIAYLAHHYRISETGVDASNDQGVFVEVEDYPGKLAKLVLVPSPTRIVLNIGADMKKEVWKAPSNA